MLSKTSLCSAIATHGAAVVGGGGIYLIYTSSLNNSSNPIEFVNDVVKCNNLVKDIGSVRLIGDIEYHSCDSITTTLPPLEGIDHDFSHSSTEFEMNKTFRSNTTAYKGINKGTKGTITPQTSTTAEESFYHNGNYGKNTLYFLKTTTDQNDIQIESLRKRISYFLLERTLENTLTFHKSSNPPNTPANQECHHYGIIQQFFDIKYGICNRTSQPHYHSPTNIKTFHPSDKNSTTFVYGGHTQTETKDAFTWENINDVNNVVFENTPSDVYLHNTSSLKEHELKQLIRRVTMYVMYMNPTSTFTPRNFDMRPSQGRNSSVDIDNKTYIFATQISHRLGIDFENQINDCKFEYCAIGVKDKSSLTVGYNKQREIVFVTQTSGNTYIYAKRLNHPTTEAKTDLAKKIDTFLKSPSSSQTVSETKFKDSDTQQKHNYSFLDMTYIYFSPTIPLDQCKKQRKKYCEGKLMVTSEGYKSGSNTDGKVLFYKNENNNSIVINLSGGDPEDKNQQFVSDIDDFMKQDT